MKGFLSPNEKNKLKYESTDHCHVSITKSPYTNSYLRKGLDLEIEANDK